MQYVQQQILGQAVTSHSGEVQGTIRGMGIAQATGRVSSITVEGKDGQLYDIAPQCLYQQKGTWVWNRERDVVGEVGMDILQKTVCEVGTGQRIGKVQDWAVDLGSWRLLQLEVVGPWWVLGRKQVLVPRRAIDHMNEKGIWVRRKSGSKVKFGGAWGFSFWHGVGKGAWSAQMTQKEGNN